jgi:hypothetical protein
MMKKLAGLAFATAMYATSAQAVVVVSVEAAGVTNTTTYTVDSAVETFNDDAIGANVVTTSPQFTTFGQPTTYTGTKISAANQFGGAGGTGNFASVTPTASPFVLSFAGETPLTYFGLYASAINAGNAIQFYNNGALLDTFSFTSLSLSSGYKGNPNAPFAGLNGTQNYVFVNFVIGSGYDEVRLLQNGSGSFEVDNLTIGFVPEPQTWAMLIVGFGLVGVSMRRRKSVVA